MAFLRTRHRPLVVSVGAVIVGVSLLLRVAWAEPFAGRFSGDGLSLTLRALPQNAASYTGTLVMKGQKMPVRGSFDTVKGFHGTFESGGEQFAFSLERRGDTFVLTSDNATYNLKSQTPASATTSKNPLVANKAKKTSKPKKPSTPQPNAAPASGNAKGGYLGLATVTDDEDQIRVMMVVAGGPAEKAGVRRGDVVLELNGRPLRSNDELVPAMRGPVGSQVKLLLGRENEEGDYNPLTVTITRGAMPGTTTARTGGTAAPHGAARPMPANQPNVGRPNVNGAGGSPRAVAGFPAFLKPGTRLVYNQGDSVVHGVKTKHVPSPDGGHDQDTRDSGGVAYVTIDIVQADADFVAADARSYLMGVEGYPVSTGGFPLTGNANAFGGKMMSAQFDYWIAPARLAQMRQGRLGTETISRIPYQIAGKNYNAISITTKTDKIFESEIYDLNTGLLLSSSRSYEGDPVTVRNGSNLGPGRGARFISHVRFMGMREINVPWANAPAPDWAVAGRRLDFQGTSQTLLRDSPLPPLPPAGLALSFGIQRAAGKSVLATMTMRSPSGSGLPPHETSTPRCYGSTSLLGLWVSPDALRRLQPNQVIDQDTVTQRRVVFIGIQGNAAVFMDQGPIDTSYSSFDTQSGMLIGFQSAEQMANIGQRQIRLQLAGTR